MSSDFMPKLNITYSFQLFIIIIIIIIIITSSLLQNTIYLMIEMYLIIFFLPCAQHSSMIYSFWDTCTLTVDYLYH